MRCLLYFNYVVHVCVLCLFLAVSRVGQMSMIEAFSSQRLIFFYRSTTMNGRVPLVLSDLLVPRFVYCTVGDQVLLKTLV